MHPQVQIVQITDAHAGQRLDNFLFTTLKGVPKTHIYKLIRSGQVRINKKRAKAESKIRIGDAVRIPPVRVSQKDKQAAQAAPARQFEIVYEDDCLLAINKPEGIAVHGGSGVSYGVIESLRQARPEAKYLELVHRLDKETSGLLLVAKKRSALVHLQEQFKSRKTHKRYLACVYGLWPNKQIVIDTPLHKYLLPNGERRVKPTHANDPAGKYSLSIAQGLHSWQTRWGDASLVKVSIKTGRTHQIRVHLADKGHPIVGDTKYGDTADGLQQLAAQNEPKEPLSSRMFLHAWQLQIQHPHTEATVQLEASLPASFNMYLPTSAVQALGT